MPPACPPSRAAGGQRHRPTPRSSATADSNISIAGTPTKRSGIALALVRRRSGTTSGVPTAPTSPRQEAGAVQEDGRPAHPKALSCDSRKQRSGHLRIHVLGGRPAPRAASASGMGCMHSLSALITLSTVRRPTSLHARACCDATGVDGFAKPPLPGFFRVPRRRPHFRRAARAVAFCAARSSASRSRYEFASILTTSAQCVSRSTSVTTHAAFGKMSPHS